MKNFFTIFFLVLGILCNAQNTFNLKYPNALTLRNIIQKDNGYVVVGSSNISGKVFIYSAFLDETGNIIWEKNLGDTINHWYHGIENSLSATFNNGFSLGGSKTNGTNGAALLVRFNSEFDTLWTKTYLEGTHFIATYQCKQTPDSGFVLVGYTDYGNAQYDYDALLIKTDSLGNMEWYKKYGGSGSDKAYIVEKAFDGGFYLAGYTNSYSSTGKWYLIKTDNLGNQQWYKTYGSELGDGKISGLTITTDSCLLISAGFTMEVQDFTPKSLARIIKTDPLGNIIWDKRFGEILENNFFTSITEKENGDIAVMRAFGNANQKENDINLLDCDGNFLWRRSFRQFPSYSIFEESLRTIISTPDKGFAMAGWGYSPSASPTQQMWVVKTDSLGCDGTENCSDTALMLVSYPDTVCYYGDTTQLLLHIQGVSAPYSIYLDGVLAADSVFYPSVYSNIIEVPMCFTPDFVNSNQSVMVTITDGFGHSVIENITFYVKDCDLGVEEVFSGRLQIYPNPAYSTIRLMITDYGVNVEIYNVEGKKEVEIEDFSIYDEIDISSLENGIYMVRVITEKGVYLRKLVVGKY